MKKYRSTGIPKLMLIFILLFLASGCTSDIKQPGTNKPVSSPLEQTQEFEDAIEKISECFTDISSRSQMIFRRDKEIPINSNPESYKIIITDGITTCEKWESTLAGIKISEDTRDLIKLTKQYISNQKMSFKYLLAYVEKKNLNDIDLSNKHSRLAAENMKAYPPELMKILDRNHYVYELKDGYVHFETKLQP